ncbi:Undecaprenyl-diphosphatase [Planctomycetes bacterium Pla163]|uniref:Undecaprenyl-diphosphatase n=1 Tax=Rohdeia mirabilis TaxID=2528008 RepID=A0A518D092_9BACT|nr:Undecaprenyl-diphosphatase [Planctomycetes bacterium Pla163]
MSRVAEMLLEPSVLDAIAQADGSGASAWFGVGLLAAVQGLTEFLPVSSSGHLSLVSALLERSGNAVPEAGLALNVVLHVGTLVAVAAIYGRDLVGLLLDALKGRPRLLALVLLGSLPAGVVGIGAKSALEEVSTDPTVSAVCLLVTAVLLLLGERSRRRIATSAATAPPGTSGRTVGAVDALLIGCAQALAILPGISRSGATIATGLLRGLDARESARFSFLLGFVAIAGAAVLEVPDALGDADANIGRLFFGLVLSAVVGVLALRLLLVALAKGAFVWFALYCASVGVAWLLFFDAGPST